MSPVAMRTRQQFQKMVNDFYDRKRQKEKEWQREKSRDPDATNATEGENGDELESNKVGRSGKVMVTISSDEEEKGKNVNRKISRKKMKQTAKRDKIVVVSDDKGSGSDVPILREVEMEEYSRSRKRSKETVYKGENGHDDDDDDDDGGSGGDVFVGEDYVPPIMRDDLVKGRKKFASRRKRGRSDGIRLYERMTVENEGSGEGAREKGKGPLDLAEKLQAFESESFSSKENADNSDNLVRSKKLFESRRMRGRSDGIRRDERMAVENSHTLDAEPSSSKKDVDDSDKDYNEEESESLDTLDSESSTSEEDADEDHNEEESNSTDIQSTGSGYAAADIPEQGIEKDDHENSVPKKKKVGREVDYMNILLGSILKDNQQKENLFSFRDNAPPTHDTLPLTFRFEDENPAAPEKEEWEKEIDRLFAEMEMCLTLPDSESSMDGVDHVTATEKSPIVLCELTESGQHQLVLEEPLGIICRCCQKVYREMMDIFPDLKKESPGRRDRFDRPRDGYRGGSIHELHFGEPSSENYYISSHSQGFVVDLIPEDIKLSMYRHQCQGFVFLWKKIVGDTCIEKLKTELSHNDGEGAIISHAPGTGKTLLTVAFIASLLGRYPTCRPVIIAPTTVLLTWENEFRKWGFRIPFHNYNAYIRPGSRMAKLHSWTKEPSVLGISYQMFKQIVSEPKANRCDKMVMVRRLFLELPGLLVLDEGHTPRNQRSLVWKVLTRVKTRRRIILSGTPFQNNLRELYNTLCLVNPKLSGPMTSESCSRKGKRKRNVEEERWSSLADKIDEKSESASLEEVKSMIDPFVHVHKDDILEERLPGLKDTIVILRPTEAQKKILQFVSDDFSSFDQSHLVSHISVHPSLAAFCKRFSAHKDKPVAPGGSPYAGVKTKFTVELIKLCAPFHEKVLVFSEHLRPLEFIMQQLMDQLKWTEGKEVLYINGKCKEKDRQASISSLNDPCSEVKVLFATMKAFSVGINLTGASRVVLLDPVWNPSVKKQATSRAYRLGQKKLVHVYHLITSGTLEPDKYDQQNKKDRLSELVFTSPGSQSIKSRNLCSSEDKILEAMLKNEKLRDVFETIIHQPKESNVCSSYKH